MLRTLRDELVRSVYSDYYAMEQQGLQFSQLPYYKAAERLEADNKHLLQEKQAFKQLLLQRQVLQTFHTSLLAIVLVSLPWLTLALHLLSSRGRTPPCCLTPAATHPLIEVAAGHQVFSVCCASSMDNHNFHHCILA